MASPALFWLMITTFGIVLIVAVVDLLKTKSSRSGESAMGNLASGTSRPSAAVDRST